MDNDEYEVAEATAQETEAVLLRFVYEAARAVLRYDGIDVQRVRRAMGEMDMAIERVKIFDGGTMDQEDVVKLLFGGTTQSLVFQVCDAYEAGYSHGMRLDGQDNANSDIYTDPRLNTAYRLGYLKGQRLAVVQGQISPEAIEREGQRRLFGRRLLGQHIAGGGEDHVVPAA